MAIKLYLYLREVEPDFDPSKKVYAQSVPTGTLYNNSIIEIPDGTNVLSCLQGLSLTLPNGRGLLEDVDGNEFFRGLSQTVSGSYKNWWYEPYPSENVYNGTIGGNPYVYVTCFVVPTDDLKAVQFGTLKKMFGVYKQKSDAALSETLANLPSGGVDTEAVNSAIDAKLETYTTERNAYVTNAVANAGYATDADVAQAVEEGTSGLATTESVAGAVDSAKTELRGEMPKPFDSTTNDQDGYLKGASVYERANYPDIAAKDIIDTCLWHTSSRDFLVVKKSDIEAVANAAIEAKMAEVREAVNGVVLYENTSHDHNMHNLSLDGNLFDTYERIEVVARAHRDIASDAQIVTAVSTFTAAEFAMGTGTGARPITHMVGYVWDASNFDEFLLGFIQVYTFLGSNPTTDVYVEDNTRNFRVAADGTNATAAIKPAGTYWVHLERVVGYKKLPEVS